MPRHVLIVTALTIVLGVQVTAWADAGQQHGHKPTTLSPAPPHHGGHWNAPAHAQAETNPVDASASSIRTGAALFRENCAACHGTDGRGNGSAAAALETTSADLVQMAPGHPDGDFAWKIVNGRGEMPGWGDVLTSEEVWHLVNYLKHLPRLASVQTEKSNNGVTAPTHD